MERYEFGSSQSLNHLSKVIGVQFGGAEIQSAILLAPQHMFLSPGLAVPEARAPLTPWSARTLTDAC